MPSRKAEAGPATVILFRSTFSRSCLEMDCMISLDFLMFHRAEGVKLMRGSSFLPALSLWFLNSSAFLSLRDTRV